MGVNTEILQIIRSYLVQESSYWSSCLVVASVAAMPWRFYFEKSGWQSYDAEANVELNEALSQEVLPEEHTVTHAYTKAKEGGPGPPITPSTFWT